METFMTRIFAAIAAVVVASTILLGATYLAGTGFLFIIHHPQLVRLLRFVAPFVGVVIPIGVAISITRSARGIMTGEPQGRKIADARVR
jgi:cytochrome b subunit of formate dehydrogenase